MWETDEPGGIYKRKQQNSCHPQSSPGFQTLVNIYGTPAVMSWAQVEPCRRFRPHLMFDAPRGFRSIGYFVASANRLSLLRPPIGPANRVSMYFGRS